MPKSKRPKNYNKTAKTQVKRDSNFYIRIAAGVVILLIVVAVIWVIVANQKPASTTNQDLFALTAGPTSAVVITPVAAAATQLPAVVKTLKYASAPAMSIDKSKQYTATFTMAKGGQFVIQLYPDKAPITVNSFVFLARQHFFDGVTFHRVLQGFMAQGGDPTGTGSGGPGYQFVNENSDLTFDKAGLVAMANSGPDTNGSQFFITFSPQPTLNGGYTIFGQVTSGMDVVSAIRLRDPQQNPTFPGDAIATVTITEK
jgi:cyclophilin family peptidyl-prolyl cis-trans isomerase